MHDLPGCRHIAQFLDMVEQVLGRPVPHKVSARRPGDPAELLADARKAQEKLGWKAEKTLQDIVSSAAAWHRKHHA